MKIGTKTAAYRALLNTVGDCPPDFVEADAVYLRWANQYARNRGPRPFYTGGELDPVNEALSLRGPARVSSLFEGFERLTRNVRTWRDFEACRALEVLRECPGLEALRLPDAVLEARADAQWAGYCSTREPYDLTALIRAENRRRARFRRVSGVPERLPF